MRTNLAAELFSLLPEGCGSNSAPIAQWKSRVMENYDQKRRHAAESLGLPADASWLEIMEYRRAQHRSGTVKATESLSSTTDSGSGCGRINREELNCWTAAV